MIEIFLHRAHVKALTYDAEFEAWRIKVLSKVFTPLWDMNPQGPRMQWYGGRFAELLDSHQNWRYAHKEEEATDKQLGNDSFAVIEVGPGIKWTLSRIVFLFLSAQAFCDALYSAHYASSENQCWMPESDSDSYNLLSSV